MKSADLLRSASLLQPLQIPAIVIYMAQELGFWDRVKLAWRIIVEAHFANDLMAQMDKPVPPVVGKPAPAAVPAERAHASGLMLLAALQREGRFIDFVQQEVAGFSDDDIGAAARVVHGGCRKVLTQFLDIGPAMPEPEGSVVTVSGGYDAQRIRLTGNVSGQPPFKGTLKHHGWIAKEVRMPSLSDALDPRVIAPSEVELA